MTPRTFYDLNDEQGVFRLSISMTIVVAVMGIVMGILSGSASIMFDGVYSMLDTVMSLLALFVVKLIQADTQSGYLSERLRKRFSMGFWHLEPMVLGLNGTLLMAVALYALVNALGSLFEGGTELHMGAAVAYSMATLIICAAMVRIASRANRTIGSALIALDIKGWLIAGCISGALVLSFGAALLLRGTPAGWLVPYVDPAALVVVCLAIIPMPVRTIRTALADVLLVTPADLHAHVLKVTSEFVERHGFTDFRAYVARTGRSREITIFIVAPEDRATRPLLEWDLLRDELGDAIGDKGPDRWLTITFTSDLRWAE
ncbi:cation diffusion facilitator family transporter [Falsirhodobacter sp. 20TX0035]|uniref:cation diffusion facilitator family transporter n=1 Tax=Falsirhodobacter sp. 20TX0035 TaxID=3022019 RepID=UPI00232B56A5|nr:cation transporter [Falsirhodobacter sp. 20TX0035]MDB6453708.1 cation transporter [Falsirhodobacter sp. 20TX0035]